MYCGFETTCCAGADLTSTELCFRISSRIMFRRRELCQGISPPLALGCRAAIAGHSHH